MAFIPSEAYDQVMANVRDIDGMDKQLARSIAEGRPMDTLKELLSAKKSRKV